MAYKIIRPVPSKVTLTNMGPSGYAEDILAGSAVSLSLPLEVVVADAKGTPVSLLSNSLIVKLVTDSGISTSHSTLVGFLGALSGYNIAAKLDPSVLVEIKG